MTISLTEDACFIGIDFSGGSQPWRSQVRKPAVWIAAIRVHGDERLTLDDLHPVQNLSGSGDAFAKLVNWLGGVKFAAAAIDAPFSIPAIHIPQGCHAERVNCFFILALSRSARRNRDCSQDKLAGGCVFQSHCRCRLDREVTGSSRASRRSDAESGAGLQWGLRAAGSAGAS